MTASPPPTLPRRTRIFALFAMVIAGLLGIGAAGGVTRLWDLSSYLEAAQKAPAKIEVPTSLLPQGPDGKVSAAEAQAYKAALQKTSQQITKVEFASLNGMRGVRMPLLILLAIAAAFAFASAGQVLMPSGFSREGTRRALVGTLLATIVLRLLDGAQTAVLARRVGQVVGRGMGPVIQKQAPEISLPHVTALFGDAMMGLSVVWTALVVGCLLLFFHHFRSEKVRAAMARIDEARTTASK